MPKYVDISQIVSATYYDEENQEWSQKTVTIEDVLCSVCDEYEIAEIPVKYIPIATIKFDDDKMHEIIDKAIIRCKDCKYSSPNKVYGCRLERYNFNDESVGMHGEDFCSYGERRTDG